MAVHAAASARAQVATPTAESLFAGLGLPEIELTATDDGLALSRTEVPAGRYLVTLRNESWDDDLIVDVVQLAAEDLEADSTCREGIPPECFYWYYRTLLPGGVSGRSPQAIIDLPAGTYGLWGPGELSILPAATLTVSGDPDAPVDGPEPQTASIIVADGEGGIGVALRIEGKLTSGPQIVEIVNAADQLVIVQAAQYPWPPTVEQTSASRTPDAVDEEQLVDAVSTSPQSPGTRQWLILELTPGPVYVACFIPDPVTEPFSGGWYKGTATVVPVSVS